MIQNKWLILIIGIIPVIIVFGIGLLIISPLKYVEYNNTEIIIINETQNIEFINIAKEFSTKHNYTPNKYDCQMYTIDLYQEYLRNGIMAEPVIGYNLDERFNSHAFIKVSVYIEPQTGKIVNFEEEYDYIENYDEVLTQNRLNKFEGLKIV